MQLLVATDRSRRTAYRLLLAVGFPAAFAVTLWLAPGKTASTKKSSTFTDRDLYTLTVQDMRAGRSYYDAHGAEMRAHGYPTQSVFNWRQPLLLPAVAYLPPFVSSLLLITLAMTLLVQAHDLLRRELLWVLTVANAAVFAIMPGEVYFTESWAGLCLGLSAVAYARNRETTGARWALVALFIRELAGPYCAIAAVLALSRRRWHELRVWSAGAVLYAVYYGAHMWQVWHHIVPSDVPHGHSWLYFGGLPFVFSVWKFNGALMAVPLPLFALVVVAGIAAWWAPKMPLHVRASVLVYSVLFLFVGFPFNSYWGELIAPLIALWLAYAPTGLSTLWTCAQLPRTVSCLWVNANEGASLKARG